MLVESWTRWFHPPSLLTSQWLHYVTVIWKMCTTKWWLTASTDLDLSRLISSITFPFSLMSSSAMDSLSFFNSIWTFWKKNQYNGCYKAQENLTEMCRISKIIFQIPLLYRYSKMFYRRGTLPSQWFLAPARLHVSTTATDSTNSGCFIERERCDRRCTQHAKIGVITDTWIIAE
jgi:hypothetical protein